MSNAWCVIEEATGLVVNMILWDGESPFEPPVGCILVQSDSAGMGWTYIDGVFYPPVIPGPTDEELSIEARDQRSYLLRFVYDPGINMALRALRMASSPEETAYAQGKVEELDNYAEALLSIPDQPGFPQTIVWPVVPTK